MIRYLFANSLNSNLVGFLFIMSHIDLWSYFKEDTFLENVLNLSKTVGSCNNWAWSDSFSLLVLHNLLASGHDTVNCLCWSIYKNYI